MGKSVFEAPQLPAGDAHTISPVCLLGGAKASCLRSCLYVVRSLTSGDCEAIRGTVLTAGVGSGTEMLLVMNNLIHLKCWV